MKLAVPKNHLRGHILYRSLDPSKKTGALVFGSISNPEFEFGNQRKIDLFGTMHRARCF